MLASLSRAMRLALVLSLTLGAVSLWTERNAYADDEGDDDDTDTDTAKDTDTDTDTDEPEDPKDQPAVTAGGLFTIKTYPIRELERPLTMTQQITQLKASAGTDLSAKGAFASGGLSLEGVYGLKDNFSLIGGQTALRGWLFYLIAPRGPLDSEVWQWLLVPRQAPPAIREAALIQFRREGHFAAGFFEQEDAENFERVTHATRSPTLPTSA